jgi:hypothetical protein
MRQLVNTVDDVKNSNAKPMNELAVKGKLVSAEQLLEQLFAPECKPSLRWLRSKTKSRTIPHIRIGHLVFFDVDMVPAALAGRSVVRHRTTAGMVTESGQKGAAHAT